MKITFLGSADSWYLRDLERAAGDRHVLRPASFHSLKSEIVDFRISEIVDNRIAVGRGWVQVPLGSPLFEVRASDVVLVRTMPPGSLEQVVFRMDALANLEACGIVVMNPAKAIEMAVDKYLTTSRLARAGMPVPRTIVCQTAKDAMSAYSDLLENAVLKPLFGGEGRGIARITDEAVAERSFKLLEQLGAVMYLQKYIEHEGYDIRILVMGDKVFAMRRRNKLDWRTNISRGALAEPYDPPPAEIEMALEASAVVGAPFAGVDLLHGKDGQTYVIEVNAVPGWRALAEVTSVDIAAELLAWLEA